MVLIGDFAIIRKKNAKNFPDNLRGDSKPPRTNPRTRAGPLPVEQYELLLNGQRLLIIMEIILLNKVCSNIIYHRIANQKRSAKNFPDNLTI